MKKLIVIEDITNNDKRVRLVNNKFFEWLLYMVGYAIVLIVVSLIFDKTIHINREYYGLYAFFAAIIIYVLNQTIKPILFYLTLPFTALTLGLFYPLINVFILNITSFILGDNFYIGGFLSFVVAITISILNIFMEGMIIRPIINRKGDR